MSVQIDKLREAVALSRAMAAEAGRGEWEALPRLQSLRATSLESAFALPIPAAEREAAQALIREVQRLDLQTLPQAAALRDSARGELEQMHKGRRALKAYAR